MLLYYLWSNKFYNIHQVTEEDCEIYFLTLTVIRHINYYNLFKIKDPTYSN